MKATQRMSRRLSRAYSTFQTGLVRLGTMRPAYVTQGDEMVDLYGQQQEAEAATRRAELRAERAEQKLRDHGLFGSAVGGFRSAFASMKRTLSRAFSTKSGAVSRMSHDADHDSSVYTSKAAVTVVSE
eukprot:scaffold38283_cov43-Prasinocladus_malaysianus.AAC.1